MASGLEILRDKRLANGGYSNCNYQCPEDDPHGLIEEFCCLYSEKLKAIDEKYPDSLEPKCQALTELVTDLSEQNFMLLKTVEELEREALTRAEAFSDLAEAAKNTMQQDNIRRGSETKKSNELECKILELQAALTKNEANLTSCMLEIDQLTRSLQEKSAESEELQATHERMSELESLICSLQSDLQQKNFLTESLQRENCKLKEEACDFNKSVTESSNSVKWLEERLKEKEILLCQIINERDTLQLENQQMTLDLSSQYKRIEELDKEIECLKCLVQENEQKLRNRECELQNEMKEANYAYNLDQQRLKEYEEQLCCLENTLASLQTSPDDGSKSLDLFRCRIKYLQKEIEKKNCEIIKYQDQQEKLMNDISQMRQYMNGVERQWKERANVLGCEIEKKNNLLLKYEKQIENMKLYAANDQRPVAKVKSDSAVTVNNKQSNQPQHSLESFQECREYIQVINDLISNFEETQKKVSLLWNEFQLFAKDNGDNMLVDLNRLLFSFENSNKMIGNMIGQIGNVEECKGNSVCYNLKCLKENILEVTTFLAEASLILDSSDTGLCLEGGDSIAKKKLTSAITDALSIIQVLENLKANPQLTDKEASEPIENNCSSVVSLIQPLCDVKEDVSKQLTSLKKQQIEFSQKLIQKIKDFEEGFSSYNSSSESLRKETKKLFAVILTKEKQIQKQFDEIDNLKMALSSSKYIEEASEEIDSLRKVVSNKEMQLVEKQDLIQNLRSLNHSLRTRNFSKSSPTLGSVNTSCSGNILEKLLQLEEGLINIKEKFSALSSIIVRSKDKMVKFEVETKLLVDALTKIHQDITNAKENVSNSEQLSTLDVSFKEAEYKVEDLLHALEMFICAEQRDFKEFSDSVSNYIEILLEIVEVIKQSINNEKLTKALKDENNELKEQLDKLQNRLTASICQQTDGYTKDELIQSLQEDLCRSNCYLEKLQEEYTALKMEKIEIEEKNQKVMEELQAKICNLQASLQSQASEVDSMCKLTCIIEKQNQQLCQNEIIEKSLRQEIVCKEEEIKMGKSEIKAMKNRMNTVNCMFGELQVKFEKAKDIIAQLQDNRSEQEMEIKSLKNKLNAVEALYSEVKKNLECANEYLVQYQEKLAAVEHECNDLKFQIDFQQRGIEKMTQELKEKSDQLCEIQQSNEMGRAAISRQFQSQLEGLKKKLVCWENLTFCLKKEISDRCEEANHWQTVSNKQKENLSDLIEENQYLKDENEEYRNELELNKSELCEVTAELVKSRQQVYQLNKCKEDYENDKTTIYCEVENTRKELCDLTSELDKCRQCILDLNRDKDDNENEKTVLFYELENTRKEFDQLTAELEASQQCIQELNQEKCILQNIAANLKKLLAEKRTLGTEYNLNQEDFSKNIMREQEKFIEILILKVAQMEKFLADKEEIITLLEAQLNTSTMLMMDNMDEYYEDESQLCVAVNNVENITSVTREAAYKMKLWQTLEINRRLVAMVNSLQHLNHSLLQDRR